MDTLIKILFVIVFPAFAIYFFIKYSKLKKKIKKLNKEKSREITNLETQNAELKKINTNISNQLNELSKYESIVDAEAQAKKIIDKANEKSQITQDTAQLILNDAIIDSERIIEEANIKAKQIADSSFEAKVLWIKTITKPLDYNEEISNKE